MQKDLARRGKFHYNTSMTTLEGNATKQAQNHIAACGPCDRRGIRFGILDQTSGATEENADTLTWEAINHGLTTGWLKKYDSESYEITQ